MKVSSVNGYANATCQNNSPNFGAVRLDLSDAHQLKMRGEKYLPGSIRTIMEQLHSNKVLATPTHAQLLESMGYDEVVLNRHEILQLKDALKRGTLLETIQRQIGEAKSLKLKEILPEGKSVVRTLWERLFPDTTQKLIDKDFDLLNQEIGRFRTTLFRQAENTPVITLASDFDGATPTVCQWNEHVGRIAQAG